MMHAINRARVLHFQELEYPKEYHVLRYLFIYRYGVIRDQYKKLNRNEDILSFVIEVLDQSLVYNVLWELLVIYFRGQCLCIHLSIR